MGGKPSDPPAEPGGRGEGASSRNIPKPIEVGEDQQDRQPVGATCGQVETGHSGSLRPTARKFPEPTRPRCLFRQSGWQKP